MRLRFQRATLIQVLKYLVGGGAYFWSGYLAFAFLWSGLHWRLWWAKLAANCIGWSINFGLQRFWAFRASETPTQSVYTLARYIFITAVDFVLDYCIVAGLQHVGVTPYIGQFVSAGFMTVWNYYWYKYWVFRTGKES